MRRSHSFVGLFLAAAVLVPQLSAAEGREGKQVIFLFDESGSMSTQIRTAVGDTLTRWELVQKLFPDWVSGLDPSAALGAISVGGACGGPRKINLPAGTGATRIGEELAALFPDGQTNLNAAMLASVNLFRPEIRGEKRLVLFSDGLNNCAPLGDSCMIAEELYEKHAIVVDVVSLVVDPSVTASLKCIARSSHGVYRDPGSGLFDAAFDPWPYIVFTLAMLALLQGAYIIYRHGVHRLHWTTQQAALAGLLVFLLGGLLSWLVLFAGAGSGGAMAGLVLGAALLLLLLRHRPEAPTAGEAMGHGAGGPIVFVLALMLLPTVPLNAQTGSPCSRKVNGPPAHDHIIALDLSGSVKRVIPDMKRLTFCYLNAYALPGEQVTLDTFGIDENGSAREAVTFDVPKDGSLEEIASRIDDLSVQDFSRTSTYYRPVASLMSAQAKRSRLDIIAIVISDGQSDDPDHDLRFESFAGRGLYAAPGMHGWKVAVQGGNDIDLGVLFRAPIPSTPAVPSPAAWRELALRPCLIEPVLALETDHDVTLRPGLVPLHPMVNGSINVHVRSDCAPRVRTFTIQVLRGTAIVGARTIRSAEIGESPRTFKVPISAPATGQEETELSVQLIVPHRRSTETVSPPSGEAITAHEISYLNEWRPAVSAVGASVIFILGGVIWLLRRHRQRIETTPIWLRAGTRSTPLTRDQVVPLNGGGPFALTGLPQGAALGSLRRAGSTERFIITPSPDYRLSINGVLAQGARECGLQDSLVFESVRDGVRYPLPLSMGSPSDDAADSVFGGFGMTSPVSSGPLDAFSSSGAGHGSATQLPF